VLAHKDYLSLAWNCTFTFSFTGFSASNSTLFPVFVLNFTSVGSFTVFVATNFTVCFFAGMMSPTRIKLHGQYNTNQFIWLDAPALAFEPWDSTFPPPC